MCGAPCEYGHRERGEFYLQGSVEGRDVSFEFHGGDGSFDRVCVLQKHYENHERMLSYEYRKQVHEFPYVSLYRLYECGNQGDTAYSVRYDDFYEVRGLM
jgi:hypothetical protein